MNGTLAEIGMEGGDPGILGRMAAQGRVSDSMLAHVTPGDMVIPRDAWMSDPGILQRVKRVMDQEGADYRSHMVGSGYESINPETGQPEFFIKALRKAAKFVAPIAGTILGSAVGAPYLGAALSGALGAGAGTLVAGGDLKDAALAGVGSYVGGKFLGSGSGDVAGNLTSNTATRSLGETLATSGSGSLLGQIGAASVPQLSGALAGQTLASGISNAMAPLPLASQPEPSAGALAPGPSDAPLVRQKEAALPSALGDFANLDPLQRSTGLATKGAFGGGLGKEEQDYFLNLINRRLMDDQGNFGDIGQINPVEKTYLEGNLGLQFDPTAKSLLQSIANRQARV